MSQLISLLVTLFGTVPLLATQTFIPTTPFPERFQEADVVAYGEIIEVDVASRTVPEFKVFDKQFVKVGKLRVKKLWKGKKENELEFYFVSGLPTREIDPSDQAALDLKAMESKPLRKGFEAILYLKRFDGILVAQARYGMKVHTADSSPKLSGGSEYRALDLLKKGKRKDAIKVSKEI